MENTEDIKSLYINNIEQTPDETGAVNLKLEAKVKEDVQDNGFVLSLGSARTTLKTTSDVVLDENGVPTEESIADDNALVRGATVRQLITAGNSVLSSVKAAEESILSKRNAGSGTGSGMYDGSIVSFVLDGCCKRLVTADIFDTFKSYGVIPTVSLVPAFIEQGFGRKSNGDRYDALSTEDIYAMQDAGCDFISNSYSRDRTSWYQYPTEDKIELDNQKARNWFRKNGIQPDGFEYPFGVTPLIKRMTKVNAGFALRSDGDGVNVLSTDRFELSSMLLDGDNSQDVFKTIFDVRPFDKKWLIIRINTFDENFDSADVQRIVEACHTADLHCVSLYQGSQSFAKIQYGTDYDFSLRKDGLLTASLDRTSINGLTNQIDFGSLSFDFKKALFDFCFDAIGKIPATAIVATVNGNEIVDGMELEAGEYTLGYSLEPTSASPATNIVEFSIPEEYSSYVSVEDGKLIVGDAVATVKYTDADGEGENGLIISTDTEVSDFKLVATLSNYLGKQEFTYNIKIK